MASFSKKKTDCHDLLTEALGTGLNRRHHSLKIERFQGELDILELSAYPISYMPKRAGTSFNLTERGKKYCNWLKKGFSHCWYDGLISRHKSTPYTKHMHIAVSRSISSRWRLLSQVVLWKGYY